MVGSDAALSSSYVARIDGWSKIDLGEYNSRLRVTRSCQVVHSQATGSAKPVGGLLPEEWPADVEQEFPKSSQYRGSAKFQGVATDSREALISMEESLS